MLLLVNNDNQKHKQAGNLIMSAIEGTTSSKSSLKPLPEQNRWKTEDSKLNCYQTVGQFDITMLEANWKTATKEGLEYARKLIAKYCIGMNKFILEQFDQIPDCVPVIMAWLSLARIIIPSCLEQIHKEGSIQFGATDILLKKTCGEDNELLMFYKTLRINLITGMNKLLGKVKPTLELKTNQKFPSKLLKCILSMKSCFRLNFQVNEKSFDWRKRMSDCKDPTCKSNKRKYSLYFESISNIRKDLSSRLEKELEEPFPELIDLLNNMADIIMFTPNLVFHSFLSL